MINMKFSEIIKANHELVNRIKGTEYKIGILSNIMVHQSKDICEYSLRQKSINANVELGDYDNIVQDSMKFQDVNAILVFWEIYNFIDGLQYKIEILSDEEFEDIIEKIKIEINIVFTNLEQTSLLLINKFSSLIFNQYNLVENRMDRLVKILNEYLESKMKTNMKLIDIDKVISKISIKNSIDLRYYYSSKTLYSIDFYKEYFEYIKPIFLSVNGKTKKALIFDCDNTLWKGILGEDGFDNIRMFKEVQYLALELSKGGVVIGLCSKNNPEDVDAVLEKHQDMILRDKDIVIKKVNWNDKVSNLKAIAKELNIGLDSLVFVDDSNFEVNLINVELPMVKVLQVPAKEYEYNLMIRNAMNYFYNPTQTAEDLEKVKMYKEQVQRVSAEQQIGNIEDYLKSLDLVITTYIDDIEQIGRISQMTQKTNQFNLTTKRYTEKDIECFIHDKNKTVIAIGVNDKYGDNGIVGLAIINYNENMATLDTLLMSCRVLGRNIEYKFIDIIVDFVKNMTIINSEYVLTYKNKQVENLYDRYGFDILQKDESCTKYQLDILKYRSTNINYIKVENAK